MSQTPSHNSGERDSSHEDKDGPKPRDKSSVSQSPKRNNSSERSFQEERKSIPPRPQLSQGHSNQIQCLYVSKLSGSIDDEDLRKMFSKFGKIEYAQICYQPYSEQQKGQKISSGYGFVKFTTPQAAETALEEMNGQRIRQKVIKVEYSKRAAPHKESRGPYYGKDTRRRENSRSHSAEQRSRRGRSGSPGRSQNNRFRQEDSRRETFGQKKWRDQRDRSDSRGRDRYHSRERGNRGSPERRYRDSRERDYRGSRDNRVQYSRENESRNYRDQRQRSRSYSASPQRDRRQVQRREQSPIRRDARGGQERRRKSISNDSRTNRKRSISSHSSASHSSNSRKRNLSAIQRNNKTQR